MAVAKTRLSPAVRAGYLAPYDSWAHRVAVNEFVRDIPMKPGHRSYETLVEVENGLAQFQDCPLLLIWGMRDWCFTPKFLEEFERRFPHAQSVQIDDAGHYVFEDAPGEMIAAIRRFVG
jgi:haloalkane dehalogenase